MQGNKCTEKQLPLITIGVSAYNREAFLPECLDSLLAQSYPRCEIIVVDDGSTDGTPELMKEKYPQIKYYRKENGGDSSAKNFVANVASGEYLVFNDSDDVFYPDTVERLFNALDPADKTACSYGAYQTIDAVGKELPTKKKIAVHPSGDITEELLEHIIVNSCGTLIPRSVFLEHGSFDSSLRVCHDWALFLELSLDCKFHAVQEPVFKRRRHGSNLSSGSYDKEYIVLSVFENFVARHPEVENRFKEIVIRRRGALHRKLYRHALREKKHKEAAAHAKNAFKLQKNAKNFFSLLYSTIFLKGC